MAKISIIGSGFSGLAASCFAAKEGHQVTVFEKNSTIGGRARVYSAEGFTFDMGPSWYWMPDVFENFFGAFGKSASDYYELKQLDPGFQIIFGREDVIEVPASMDELEQVFESIEAGSALALRKFLKEAEFKYQVGMKDLVYKPAFSWLEYANMDVVKGMLQSNLFSSVSSYVGKYFKDKRLVALMEFPVLFLGAMASKIPALYTMMNYSALVQGTFYPVGGMCRIVSGMQELAESLGVQFHTGLQVEQIEVSGGLVSGLRTNKGLFETEGLIAAADYHHVEQQLLDERYRNYDEKYWEKKTFAPSCLIYYVGVSKKLNRLLHHNLFFDADFNQHANDIYSTPQWPEKPLFYVCCPSKTDPGTAPEGMENIFILVPVAAGLKDDEQTREQYFKGIISRMESFCGEDFADQVVYKKTYAISDFTEDYNAYKGNAYGLANTLMQTAVLKPSLKNKQIKNMFYAGQLTVPGPGVPPALISGQVAANELAQYFKK
ncbi:phytoene desaturase [Pedobacter westerhofensis]|uniref:Phytoene desaturase n=1 Tax=Pedobacter westerhofensis TaxID=425512 RepID=A0A521FFS5_9SPHI|nr:phytoene desaturase family protein [Pedobacter westerhofensis]SMO95046.1 phytoene desaturase [Pedobacter westerhofensis]